MTIASMEKPRNTDDVVVHFKGMQTILVEEHDKPTEAHLSVWIKDHLWSK